MARAGMFLAILAISIALSATTWAAIDFSECGGVVPDGEVGVLQNDIVCEYRCENDRSIVCDPNADTIACPGTAYCEPDLFTLGRGSTLRLNGHSIAFAYQAAAVVCEAQNSHGRCRVIGPGTIIGGKGTGIYAEMSVSVKDVTIEFTDEAIHTDGLLYAHGLHTADDRENEVDVAKDAYLTDSVINGDAGISVAGDLIPKRVHVGPHGGWLRAAGTIHGHDVTLDGGRYITGGAVVMRRLLSLPDYSSDAIISRVEANRRLVLRDSSVGFIKSGVFPQLIDSWCAISRKIDSTDTWYLCAYDEVP